MKREKQHIQTTSKHIKDIRQVACEPNAMTIARRVVCGLSLTLAAEGGWADCSVDMVPLPPAQQTITTANLSGVSVLNSNGQTIQGALVETIPGSKDVYTNRAEAAKTIGQLLTDTKAIQINVEAIPSPSTGDAKAAFEEGKTALSLAVTALEKAERIVTGTTDNALSLDDVKAASNNITIASGHLAGSEQLFTEAKNAGLTDTGSAITAIDGTLQEIKAQRATYGAAQSRFEGVVSVLQVSRENQTAAASRIMDADYAAETATLTRAQILQQAGTAMLAQANALPNNVLSLLR